MAAAETDKLRFAESLENASEIDWSSKNLLGDLTTESKRVQLESLFEKLSSNLTEQQYLYDSKVLDGLTLTLWSLFKLYEQGATTSLGKLTFHKLLAHEAYGQRKYHRFAVQQMLQANEIAKYEKSRELSWYRVFFLDHATNRMTPDVMGCRNDEDRQELIWRRNALQLELESMLPRNFGGLACDKESQDCNLLLRAAHYWGHRGNHCLSEIQAITRNESGMLGYYERSTTRAKIFRPVDDSVVSRCAEDGLRHYDAAIRFRACSFSQKFDDDEVREYIEKYKSNFTGSDMALDESVGIQTGEIEQFNSRAQAAADIASQHAARCCIHSYLACTPESRGSRTQGECVEQLVEEKRLAEGLWRTANHLAGTEGIEPFRAMAWRRLYEHMTYEIVQDEGRPVNFYEEPLSVFESDVLNRFRGIMRS